jgi:hypothetical protein
MPDIHIIRRLYTVTRYKVMEVKKVPDFVMDIMVVTLVSLALGLLVWVKG